MSIRSKFILAFLSITLWLLFMGSFALVDNRMVGQNIKLIEKNNNTRLRFSYEVESHINQLVSNARELIIEVQENDKEKIQIAQSAVKQSEANIEKHITNWKKEIQDNSGQLASNNPKIVKLDAELQNFIEKTTMFSAYIASGKIDMAKGYFKESIEPASRSLQKVVSLLKKNTESQIRAEIKQIRVTIATNFTRTIIILCLAIFASIFTGVVFANSILRPIRTLTMAFDSVIAGDFTKKIPYKRKDEIGELGAHFNRLIEELNINRENEKRRIEAEESAKYAVELLEAQKQVAESSKLASIGVLAAGVGHEINNPLAIADGNIRKLKKELKKLDLSSSIVEDTIKNYEIASKRIANIVTGLRAYAREGSEELTTTPVHEAISQTIGLVSTIFEKEDIKITAYFPDGELFMHGSLEKLQQILMNLITNAKDATLGQKIREIKVTLKKGSANKLVIEVNDNGSGIPPAVKHRIFDPFFTTKKVGQGTGMGLGIVAKIVNDLNGSIDFNTSKGKGTTFILKFNEIPSEKKTPAILNSKQEDTKYKPVRAKILVVDDEDPIREIFSDLLAELECEVSCASSGSTALKMLQNESFDIVITDLKMPEMDGFTLLKKIKKLNLTPVPNLMIMSGGINVDLAQAVKDYSLDGYLHKPFQVDKVYHTLASLKSDKREAA